MGTKRPRNAAQTRADILSAARRRFATEGFERTTLRAIAAEAPQTLSSCDADRTIADTMSSVRSWASPM
jgi:DNA-binding transcriptional regulator YbjK